MNELEFIMGDVSTPYGALRAKLGFPEPWVIKYVEVGPFSYASKTKAQRLTI